MTIENSVQVRQESKAAGDLPHPSVKGLYSLGGHGREVLGITSVANDGVRRNAMQNERRGWQACRTDDYIGLAVERL